MFVASCISLIATALVFSIRGDILPQWEKTFNLNPEQVGWISGIALWGFLISIFIGGQLLDFIGVKAILVLAFLGQVAGTLLTIYATGPMSLIIATLIIGIGNGFVEAGVNPLVTTIYPEEKTAKLNALHAWWPGGLVIGSLLAWLFSTQQATWQAKMWIILIPVVIYGLMLFTIKFPATERVQSGVTTGQMYREALKPLFLLWLFCMLLTGAAELGTNQWISAIMKTFGIKIGPFEFGSLALAWISLVMLVGRLSAVGWLQRMNPVALLIGSSVVSAIGLILLGMVNSPAMAIFACFVFAVGVCYYWPTMLGFTSERFPAGGSFLLGLMGAAGMASAGAASGLLGKLQMALSPSADAAGKAIGAARSLQVMAVLPVILTVIFVCVYLYDQKRGGYKKVELGAK
jgi:MFS family permease